MNPTEPAISAKPVFGPASAVLALAVSGRWRSPETTAALAHQAATQARSESDISTALLAEGWLLHGLIAVGRGATGVASAVAALEDAMRSGNAAAEARLRVGLASVVRELGDVGSASGLLGPVIERDIIDPELGVDAYLEVIRCGGHPVAGGAHAAVDLVVGHIRRLRGEQVELGLAALDSALAAQHRIEGRNAAAVARAREGLRRVLGETAAGSELDPVSPHLAATLSLELTRALLNDGQPELACRVAEPALAWAGRPAALVPLTRLRLVLAERAYLPAGQYDAALGAVAWAAGVVGEHDLPELEAECQSLLADVQERRGALSDALAASRRAQGALRTHSARVEHALVLLGRCVGAGLGRPTTTGASWEQSRFGPTPSDRGQTNAAPGFEPATSGFEPAARGVERGMSGFERPAPTGLDAVVNNATVRLRSVKLRPEGTEVRAESAAYAQPNSPSSGPARPGPAGAWPAQPGHAAAGTPGPADASSWHQDDPIRRASSGGFGARESVPGDWWPDAGRWSGAAAGAFEPADDRNARPAATMASSSLDDWAAVTGWPGEPSEATGLADTAGLRASDTTYHRPEGIGAISATRPDIPHWSDSAALTSAFAPVQPVPPPTFDTVAPSAVSGERDEVVVSSPVAVGFETDHEYATDPEAPAAAAELVSESEELDELFDPDEQRPLGLVAIDVVTPRGPLTGYVAKPLLAHIAEQARAQLPANARLQVLSSDAVLVVLPPVEPDVVLRWMRSLATRLSARWTELAADVPRSAYRVATGAYDGQLSAADNVERLRARLGGFSQPATSDPGSPPGGGRHVARGGSPRPATGSSRTTRTSAEPGSGGRRRRPDGNSAAAVSAPAMADGGSRHQSGTGQAGPSAHQDGGSSPRGSGGEGLHGSGGEGLHGSGGEGLRGSGGEGPERVGRQYSRGRGIDRVALARLTQMAWRPPTPVADGADDIMDEAAESDGRETTGARPVRSHRAPSVVAEGPTRNGAEESLLVGNPLPANGVAGANGMNGMAGMNGAAGLNGVIGANGMAAANGMAGANGHAEVAGGPEDLRRPGVTRGPATPEGPGTAEPIPGLSAEEPETGAARRSEAAAGRRSEAAPARASEAAPVAELSFAELLAGALAAYRDS